MRNSRIVTAFLLLAVAIIICGNIFSPQPSQGQGGQPAWQGTPGTPNDFLIEVVKGNVPGHRVVYKFGNATVGTSLVPITASLNYRTPSTAQALEFVSSDANDTALGSGAREITFIGLDDSWTEVTQTIATNGLTAVDLPTDLVRLYRWYVSQSGSYATQSIGSHQGVLTVRADGAGETWSTIAVTPFALGQSEIGAYTVPIGERAYVFIQELQVDSTKTVDAIFFHRGRANTSVAPFGVMHARASFIGISGSINPNTHAPQNGFTAIGEAADIGYMAKVATATADISVIFEILLIKDGY